jgi:hypothetical protein
LGIVDMTPGTGASDITSGMAAIDIAPGIGETPGITPGIDMTPRMAPGIDEAGVGIREPMSATELISGVCINWRRAVEGIRCPEKPARSVRK